MQVLIPPVQTALWCGAQVAVARLIGRRRRPSLPERLGAVAAFGTAGVLGLGALRQYNLRDTTWHPWAPHKTTALITDGAHALTRNPMYVALALVVAGTGLLSGVPWTAAAAQGLMTTLTPQVRREEAALERRFGRRFRTYARRVRRWL